MLFWPKWEKKKYSLINIAKNWGFSQKSKQAGSIGQGDEGGDVWDCCVQGSDMEVHSH